eukprot:TRINITY_DN3081_c0_g1_i1.p1 TRINITY_DN3081_c0_g1~~TRINITY_DN3081_c0_g1_i1.p1  ORF type:complete len:550 (-),score=73.80 TRINITY_DN3081_c0_g1_i1:82-1731(-)
MCIRDSINAEYGFANRNMEQTERHLVSLSGADGHTFPVNVSLIDLEKLKTNGAVIATFAEGSEPTKGSLGAICNAYKQSTSNDLVPIIYTQIFGEDSLSPNGLPQGMKFGRVKVGSCGVFSSLWIIQLPATYNLNDLAILYNYLKSHMKDILASSADGTISMPLIGVHPTNGVRPSDVIEELLSTFIYFSTNVAGIKGITLFMRQSSLSLLEQGINAQDGFEMEVDVINSEQFTGSALRVSDSLKVLLPENVGQTMDDLNNLLKKKEKDIDSRMIEAVKLVLVQWRLCKSKLEDHEVKLSLLSVGCMQARRVLERFCRLVSGDRRINAGFKEIANLVATGKISRKLGEICDKLIRNGNKAAHTDVDGTMLTEVDLVVSLQCVIQVIERTLDNSVTVIISEGPLPPAINPSHDNSQQFLPGDWRCTQCSNHNFATRSNCRSCNAAKPAFSIPVTTSTSVQPPVQQGNAQPMPGDWTCFCGNLNFARRTECMKCAAQKPTLPGPPTNTVPALAPAPAPAPVQTDWFCRCGVHNYAFRQVCKSCNLVRPSSQ